jgi:hypothetical protein
VSNLNNYENRFDYSNRKLKRENIRKISNFYNRNRLIINKSWWSVLSYDEKYEIYRTSYFKDDMTLHIKEMRSKFDKTIQIRDKKILLLLK